MNFRMFAFLHALRNREEGQALVEYGLILGLIAVVCIASLTLLGQAAQQKFNTTANAIKS